MYRILLADDEGIVTDTLKFIIEKEFGDTCEIMVAHTGRTVIELTESFRPDIAFMDIQMPGINGIDAMKEIRRQNENLILIVLSAYDKFDYAKEALNLGVKEYLNKPVDRDKIIEVLKSSMAQIDRTRRNREKDLQIREKMEIVVPVIENGFIYNLLLQEYFEEDVNNYKNLLDITEERCFMGVLVFGDSREGNHMTNAVGSSVKLHKHYNDVRDLVRGYFRCFVGAVTGNKIPVMFPTNEEELSYNDRVAMIDRARELCRKIKGNAVPTVYGPMSVTLTGGKLKRTKGGKHMNNVHFRHSGATANFNWADGHATSEKMTFQNIKDENVKKLNAGNIGPDDKDTYYTPLQEGKGAGTEP